MFQRSLLPLKVLEPYYSRGSPWYQFNFISLIFIILISLFPSLRSLSVAVHLSKVGTKWVHVPDCCLLQSSCKNTTFFSIGRFFFIFVQSRVFGYVLLLQLIHDCDVGFHGREVAVASPFHNHFRWYTETERVHYKSTAGVMCGNGFPFRDTSFLSFSASEGNKVLWTINVC